MVLFAPAASAEATASADDPNAPFALYLSWQQDPTTTMTVQWITDPGHRLPEIEYWEIDEQRRSESVSTVSMVFTDRTLHTAELTGLSPATEYRFRLFGSGLGESTRDYSFRTMPADAEQPLRIAVGGDIRHRAEWMERTARQAMRFDPDFMIWGGDFAYADGKRENLQRWDEFFSVMMDTLITEEGRVVPVVMAIGNHEVEGHYYWENGRTREAYRDSDAFRSSIAPYFYNLFAFPGHPGYNALDFGDYLSLIVLDTDHTGPVEGKQAQWLRERLAERDGVTHVLPIYHVPAYPSVRDFDGQTPTRIREHWVPLFEQYGVRLAFEHHGHAYKRTVSIREGKPDDTGVIYVGDGAWGVGTREVHNPEQTWYLQRAESKRHFILLTITGEHLDLKAIDEEGQLIDHFVAGASGGAGEETAAQAEDSPQAVVRRFSAAILDMDLESTLTMVAPGSPAEKAVRQGMQLLAKTENPNIPGDAIRLIRAMMTKGWSYASIGTGSIDGETAAVPVRRPDQDDREIRLIRVKGEWLIQEPADIIELR